jgi:hypothetical protein
MRHDHVTNSRYCQVKSLGFLQHDPDFTVEYVYTERVEISLIKEIAFFRVIWTHLTVLYQLIQLLHIDDSVFMYLHIILSCF